MRWGSRSGYALKTTRIQDIGMPNNMSCKLLFRNRNYAQHRITRQETLQPTALPVDTNGLAHRPVAYRLARMTAIRIGWPVTANGRVCEAANGSFREAKLAGDPSD
ncbi:hypothetical protein MASR2M50_33990 [Thauera sp.]|jgi:hypothetical protein